MSESKETLTAEAPRSRRLLDRFARHLGVSFERKQEIYISLSQSASLLDASYWLQILFAAGIATLGLILNSPAVIIGAMLISPLMGPILASGLALATGDFILAVRAIVNLALSCAISVSFAVILVALLPFKEMTGEIAARTQPTTLDLFVALFSGAIGSIATCKDVKGVVTSIPGVAIAVALMPPLCVIGYGMGVAFSVNEADGLRVASGGGLLFLTNLVAITFTAMLVFLLLRIATAHRKKTVEDWQNRDAETLWFRKTLGKFPLSNSAKAVGSLPGRLLMILIPILIILVPLSRSFSQLKTEIERQKQENHVKAEATKVWDGRFAKFPDGKPRSYLDRLVVQDGPQVGLSLRVFTSKPYSPAEKAEYVALLSASLHKPRESIDFKLIEIPTTSNEIVTKSKQEEKPAEEPPTISQLQANFLYGVASALKDFRLPAPAIFVDFKAIASQGAPLTLTVIYLSERDIDSDAQALLTDQIRSSLADSTAVINFQRIPFVAGRIAFGRNRATLSLADQKSLDSVANIMLDHPLLVLDISAGRDKNESEDIVQTRNTAISDYITAQNPVLSSRIKTGSGDELSRVAILKYMIK